ncbi:MAG TPA: nucleoside deaminase [Burkholderiales bacterium]|nr:nucleoside deaminase [Burkholderiales bacterium]
MEPSFRAWSDEALLRHVIALSVQSRKEGHHPFAALVVDADGTRLAQAFNASNLDRTAHAEMNALRRVGGVAAERLRGATLYSSAEPCAMCAGALYWSGIGRLAYALSEARLLALTGSHPENPTLSLPCREVFARGQRHIEVIGPMLEEEAAAAHAGFWHL